MQELTFTISKIYPPSGNKPALILAGEGVPGIKVWPDTWRDGIVEGATLSEQKKRKVLKYAGISVAGAF